MELLKQAKEHKKIFITGFIGSRCREFAENLAKELEYDYIDIDKEIEKSDGRSVKRICMMMGEHEYRNKEYEELNKLDSEPVPATCKGLVISCSDGIILDDMNMDILKRNFTVFIKEEPNVLFENAMLQKDLLPYAFFLKENQNFVKNHFLFLYESRLKRYNQFISFEFENN